MRDKPIKPILDPKHGIAGAAPESLARVLLFSGSARQAASFFMRASLQGGRGWVFEATPKGGNVYTSLDGARGCAGIDTALML